MRHPLQAIVAAALLLSCPAWSAAQAGTLQKIKDTGTFTIGYRAESPPFSSLAAGAAEPQGFAIDLCRRIGSALQASLGLSALTVRYVPVTAENRFDAVAGGQVDIECANSTITLSRLEKVDFSLMTFITGASLLTTSATTIPAVKDLAGKTVTVVSGTTTEKALEQVLAEEKITATVVRVADHGAGLRMLDEGKSAGHVADQLVLVGLARAAADPGKYTLVAEPFTYEPYGLTIRRNDDDFRLAVNRVLARLYRSGEIGQVYERWFGDWGGRPSRLLIAMWALNGIPE